MVRALLAGTKTQTRRICKNKIVLNGYAFNKESGHIYCHMDELPPSADLMQAKHDGFTGWWYDGWEQFCPYGQPGDRLWVRETWGYTRQCDDMGDGDVIAYAAGGEHVYEDADGKRRLRLTKSGAIMRPNHYCYPPKPWKPSIHMPRWASRITLEIAGVRVERLQEISAADAIAEGIGIAPHHPGMYEAVLADNGKGSRIVCAVDDPTEAYRALWNMINGSAAWDANPWVWVVEFKRCNP
jgi:hypothetical protein